MTNVVITGGAGFLGGRLARTMLAAGSLAVAGGSPRPLSRVTLADRAPVPADLAADERVTALRGDLNDQAGARGWRDAVGQADVIFHLAAAVSAECEADFDLGIRANLRATESLLASCRTLAARPVVVFASSVAVFGASREHPLPAVIDDDTMPNPQSSYGTQQVVGRRGPASARSARSTGRPKWRWPPPPGPSTGSCAPRRRLTRSGVTGPRSTSRRSP